MTLLSGFQDLASHGGLQLRRLKKYKARYLFGTKGCCCRSSPPPLMETATDFDEDRQLGHAHSFLWTGLLFVFSSRGLCAKVVGQLSFCILLELSLYLYSLSCVRFLGPTPYLTTSEEASPLIGYYNSLIGTFTIPYSTLSFSATAALTISALE